MNESNNFHFIRFLAASLVVVGHVFPLNNKPDLIENGTLGLFPSGHMAVCIFFIISGYLVLKSNQNSSSQLSYLFKRVLRIYPGLFVALVFTVFIIGPINTILPLKDYFTNFSTYRFFDYLKLYPSTTTMLPGVFENNPFKVANGSLWTLAYEFTMYLFVIVASLLFRKRWSIFVGLFFVFFIIFCAFHTTIKEYEKPLRIIHLGLFPLLDFGIYFVLGMIYGVYQKQIPLKWWIAVAALLLWLGLYPIAENGYIPLVSITWMRYFSLSYIIFYLSFLKGSINNFGKSGDYSYGIYIYAFPVQQTLVSFFQGKLELYWQVLIAFAIVLPLAWLSWHFVEKPALKYKTLL